MASGNIVGQVKGILDRGRRAADAGLRSGLNQVSKFDRATASRIAGLHSGNWAGTGAAVKQRWAERTAMSDARKGLKGKDLETANANVRSHDWDSAKMAGQTAWNWGSAGVDYGGQGWKRAAVAGARVYGAAAAADFLNPFSLGWND